jgi:hypothetical protein
MSARNLPMHGQAVPQARSALRETSCFTATAGLMSARNLPPASPLPED